MAGVSKQTIKRYEAGENAKANVLHRIAQALGVDPAWLLTGEGVAPSGLAELPAPIRDEPTRKAQVDGDNLNVPLARARVGAGRGDLADDDFDGSWPLPLVEAEAWGWPRVGIYAARVRGTSMERPGGLRNKDVVFFAKDPDAIDDLCVVVDRGDVLVKEVRRTMDGWEMVSWNPTWPVESRKHGDDFRVVGRVLGWLSLSR